MLLACKWNDSVLVFNHLVKNRLVEYMASDRLSTTLFALSDPTRRDILRRAMDGEHSVSMLAGAYPMSFAAVQKHVALLEHVGLVVKERRGREQLVRSDIETIRFAQRLLDQFEVEWRSRLDRFANVLSEPNEGAT